MKNKKFTTQIRVTEDDKKLWNEYCNMLGEKSSKLFTKVLKSKNLSLNEKILEEYRKKQQEIKKKIGGQL